MGLGCPQHLQSQIDARMWPLKSLGCLNREKRVPDSSANLFANYEFHRDFRKRNVTKELGKSEQIYLAQVS